MARTVKQIQQQIIDNLTSKGIAVSNNFFSRRRIWTYVIAFCINILEGLWDLLKSDVTAQLAAQKMHTERWYETEFLRFQYGFALLPDSDQFDNTGYTDEQIDASKIIKQVAVVEQENAYGRLFLRVKLETESGDDLDELDNDQLTAVTAFGQRIKDAGVKLVIQSLPADKIKQRWRIFYDPLILTATGTRIDGQDDAPVQTAIKDYLKNLPFNGIFDREYHEDAVEPVEGVVTCVLDECLVSYGSLPFTSVDVFYTPDGGWLRFYDDADLVIEFIPHDVIK